MINHTITYKKKIMIDATTSIAGPKESTGPLGHYFDKNLNDDLLGQKSYEILESKLHASAVLLLLNKTNLKPSEIDLCIGGDLNNELYATNFAMRELNIPFLGVYAACASYGLSIIIGANFIESNHVQRVICSTSSHFSTAERQFRFPLELGTPRAPQSQWTTTGAGAMLLNTLKGNIRIESATIGKVVDFGVKDVNDMGAAMAPAAFSTLSAHLSALNRNPSYYDLILTGDLGKRGADLLKLLAKKNNLKIDGKIYSDCGVLIFNTTNDSMGQGGSGTACATLVFNGYIYKKLLDKSYRRVLLITTGALLSKTSSLQNQTIPAISHAIAFERI